jgi:hypothetical protein
MDVAEGLKQPTKAERDEYCMGDYPDEAARDALEPYSVTKRTAYYLELAGGALLHVSELRLRTAKLSARAFNFKTGSSRGQMLHIKILSLLSATPD